MKASNSGADAERWFLPLSRPVIPTLTLSLVFDAESDLLTDNFLPGLDLIVMGAGGRNVRTFNVITF